MTNKEIKDKQDELLKRIDNLIKKIDSNKKEICTKVKTNSNNNIHI